MKFVQTLALFMFAFGMAAMTKYYGMAAWIENNAWVALPMMIVGAIGVVFFYGKD